MSSNIGKTVLLNNGLQMPIFGLGTWLSKNKEEMANLLRTAFDTGYRHIDTAIAYDNQEIIGEALTTIFNEGKYKREDIFIVSKIFPYKSYNVEEQVIKALKDLQIEYLDLFYIHWSFTGPKGDAEMTHKPVHVIWAELEEVQRKGLVRSLGVSNFNVQSIVDLWSYAKIKPVANQIELHVFLQQRRLVDFCRRINLHVTAYSPLAQYNDVIHNPTLQAVAKKNNATVPQVMLTFLLSQGISVIPKTDKLPRLKENLDSLNLQLSQEDFDTLKSLDNGTRIIQASDQALLGYVPIFD